MNRTVSIRKEIRRLTQEISVVRDISWPESLYRFFDQYGIPHYEEALYERISIGYEIMRRGARKYVDVVFDDELQRILKLVINWRYKVKFGAQYAQVLTALVDLGGKVAFDTLLRELLYYGLEPREVEGLVTDLAKMKMIRLKGREIELLRGDVNG